MGLVLEGKVLSVHEGVGKTSGKLGRTVKVLTNGGGPVSIVSVYTGAEKDGTFREPAPEVDSTYRRYVRAKEDFVFQGPDVQAQTATKGRGL